MHPVNYLFEDIYGNDWGIVSDAATRRRRDKVCRGGVTCNTL
ncbi:MULTISPECIES: hypothetical protein [unclassified Mesorhizobium]|nr:MULTISPECIES: hypothetical protein [unclassified Mesorhizobium]